MRKSVKIVLAALAASLLLASAVSTASARNLSVSNENIRATWRVLEFVSTFVTVRCPVTLEGSLHSRTIAKVRGSLIGAITRVTIKNEACTNGTAVAKNLPWHQTYEGFTGTLPTILAVQQGLSRSRFTITALGTSCEYGNETDNVLGSINLNAAGEATSLTTVEGSNEATLIAGGFGCSARGRLRGTAEIMVLGSTTRIRVSLI